MSSTFAKMLAALAIFALIIAAAFRLMKPAPPPPAPVEETTASQPATQRVPRTNYRPTPTPHIAEESAVTPEEDSADEGMLGISHEKLEDYLKLHGRDAASLLAAFHAGNDTNYLKEAALNFPNDPHVQWSVLMQNMLPEERRKWLDAFKGSSPANAMANYLSAQDYFKNGQPEAAVKELVEATGKSQFGNFEMDTYAGARDLAIFSGHPEMLAATLGMVAMSSDLNPGLRNMRDVVRGISNLQEEYGNAGDKTSAENLAQLGFTLANRLTDGEGSRLAMSQSMGFLMETMVLKTLDQNASYEFLGGQTPAQRVGDLERRKRESVELFRNFGTSFYGLPEAEQRVYLERVKTEGEIPALRWLQQEHPQKQAIPLPGGR